MYKSSTLNSIDIVIYKTKYITVTFLWRPFFFYKDLITILFTFEQNVLQLIAEMLRLTHNKSAKKRKKIIIFNHSLTTPCGIPTSYVGAADAGWYGPLA